MIPPVILGKSWSRRNNWGYEIDVCTVTEQHYWATKLAYWTDLTFTPDSGLVQTSMTTQPQILLCIWPLTFKSEQFLHYHMLSLIHINVLKDFTLTHLPLHYSCVLPAMWGRNLWEREKEREAVDTAGEELDTQGLSPTEPPHRQARPTTFTHVVIRAESHSNQCVNPEALWTL